MKIALIGYGKMGKAVELAAMAKGHHISSRISPSKGTQIDDGTLEEADIAIEFTHPDAVMSHIKQTAARGKSLVIGTTGWYHSLKEVDAIVKEANIGLLYAPNFSIGVQLFLKMLDSAAKLIKHFPEYDVAITESHHNKKVDSPSGTAKEMVSTLLKHIPSKNDEIPISSLRCGSIPGTHTVIFDSPVDSISITHTARSRDGFAHGAVKAAEWLHGKKGLFSIDDLLEDYA